MKTNGIRSLRLAAVLAASLLTCHEIAGSGEELFSVQKAGQYGFIDSTGKLVIPLQFLSVYEFSDGVAIVTRSSTSGEIIDTAGKGWRSFRYTRVSSSYPKVSRWSCKANRVGGS